MKIGLEVFLEKEFKRFKKTRLGVVCNQASVTPKLLHIRDALIPKKLNITAYFGPQHGIRGEKQDDMKESSDFIDGRTGMPVYSLYSTTRIPTDSMLDKIDTFLIDLQDIGTRIYTFMYTMENCMRAAKRTGKKVVILDRPNPIGGIAIEGNVLDMKYQSFVGQMPIATRHGLTMGELALLFNEEFGIGCDLEVIKLKNWKRAQQGDSWGWDWVPPSPNIPNVESSLVFPGIVHFEGTNLSEARGTTRPFEFVGAPFIDADRLANRMNQMKLPGFYFRPIYFQPTYQKCKDQVCGGVHIHLTDRKKFNAFEMGVKLLAAIWEMHPKDSQWKQPPYEYVHDKLPIDVISGTDQLRLAVESGNLKPFLTQAKADSAQFKKLWKKYCLY